MRMTMPVGSRRVRTLLAPALGYYQRRLKRIGDAIAGDLA